MNLSLRAVVLVIVAMIASPVVAQDRATAPPEPLPMGTAYIYQQGYPNWYAPVAYYPVSYYPYYSPYPYGYHAPVYSVNPREYGVFYPGSTGWWNPYTAWSYPAATWNPGTGWSYPAATWNPWTGWVYPLAYPLPGRIFLGNGR
jgi:hypothetical protein